MKQKLITCLFLAGTCFSAYSQQTMKPADTEVWDPVPKVVTPGKSWGDAPNDAIILFNGKNLDQWVVTNDTTKPANCRIVRNRFVDPLQR